MNLAQEDAKTSRNKPQHHHINNRIEPNRKLGRQTDEIPNSIQLNQLAYAFVWQCSIGHWCAHWRAHYERVKILLENKLCAFFYLNIWQMPWFIGKFIELYDLVNGCFVIIYIHFLCCLLRSRVKRWHFTFCIYQVLAFGDQICAPHRPPRNHKFS